MQQLEQMVTTGKQLLKELTGAADAEKAQEYLESFRKKETAAQNSLVEVKGAVGEAQKRNKEQRQAASTLPKQSSPDTETLTLEVSEADLATADEERKTAASEPSVKTATLPAAIPSSPVTPAKSLASEAPKGIWGKLSSLLSFGKKKKGEGNGPGPQSTPSQSSPSKSSYGHLSSSLQIKKILSREEKEAQKLLRNQVYAEFKQLASQPCSKEMGEKIAKACGEFLINLAEGEILTQEKVKEYIVVCHDAGMHTQSCQDMIDKLGKFEIKGHAAEVRQKFITNINNGALSQAEIEQFPEELLQASQEQLRKVGDKLCSEKEARASSSPAILTGVTLIVSKELKQEEKYDLKGSAAEKIQSIQPILSANTRKEEEAEKLSDSLQQLFAYIKDARFEKTNSDGLIKMRQIVDSKASPLEKLDQIISIAKTKKEGSWEWYSKLHVMGKGRAPEVDKLYDNIVSLTKAEKITALSKELAACVAPKQTYQKESNVVLYQGFCGLRP